MGNLYHAWMQPVFVLSGPGVGDDAQVVLPADLAAERAKDAALRVTSRVALTRAGPFVPIADALEENAKLRDLFAEGLDLDVARRWKTLRFTLLLGLVPLGLLAEVDRELAAVGSMGARGKMIGDLFVMGVVAADLFRRTPRHPKTIAIVLLAAALRFALFVSKGCGKAHVISYAGLAAALAFAIAIFVVAPTPARVVSATLARLGISAADVRASRILPRPSLTLLAAAFVAALALPSMLWLARWAGLPWLAQGAAFGAFGLVVPWAIELAFDTSRAVRFDAKRTLSAAAAAFALTIGLSGVARHAIDTSAQVARCVAPTSPSVETAKRLVEAQNEEVSKNAPRDGKVPLLAMNILLVPLVEERVYRGLLQRVFAARFGNARGIACAALVFGLAHLGVYRLAIYQTTLLGVSFGVAYAFGGFPAAALAHAAWNALLLLG
jgi:membrane protease YdiL (CAAX protease family)